MYNPFNDPDVRYIAKIVAFFPFALGVAMILFGWKSPALAMFVAVVSYAAWLLLNLFGRVD